MQIHMNPNPYDQLPYRCQPIEWTAPERLALASLLHQGPVPDLRRYRVLELGCGDGSNLLPLAYYRPQASFVGIDGASTQIRLAQHRQQQLHVPNVEFMALDFLQANDRLDGTFDFIIAHGVFSWVPDVARDALFALCQQRLADDGLLYLNYNTRPGWNVRGMVRDYLLGSSDRSQPLLLRAQSAQAAAAKMAQSLATEQHPFSQLLANEFQFVCDNHVSYVAHEYLAEHNHAYWRSEFLALATAYGFHCVADADYNYASGRVDAALPARLISMGLAGRELKDTEDLVSYRQLHTPILSWQRAQARQPEHAILRQLQVASCLQPRGAHQPFWFEHPNGYQVEAKDALMADALNRLATIWPDPLPVTALLGEHENHIADLLLLHNNGLLELRLPQAPGGSGQFQLNQLNQLELEWGGYCTTAQHQRVEYSAPLGTERRA